MTGFWRKIRSAVSAHSFSEIDDDVDVEYSFAMEYNGPPIAHGIPRIIPIDNKQIPTALAISSDSFVDNLALPVIQPLGRTSHAKRKLSGKAEFGSNVIISPNVETPFELRSLDGNIDHKDAFEISNGRELSCKAVDGLSESPDAKDHTLELSAEVENRSSSKDSKSFHGDDDVHELSGSSSCLNSPSDHKKGTGLENCSNPANWDSNSIESVLSSQVLSSEISSRKIEDNDGGSPCHVKRPSAVTFCDPESIYSVDDDFDHVEDDVDQQSQGPELKVMSKACHRCLKKSRFMEKEVCIVCGAKYCSNCVLRAMGSMPEGRKCVTCIGSRIHESLRGSLGKCSWMLKRLLYDAEIKQIMRRELLCEVNQPPPERIFVNGKRLSKEELNTLLCCPNPPKQLKPGSYWYDKVSGFWGKIGQRPSQIITHDLNVGNNIMKDASNGNTEILINGREITKSERTLLQFFGVQCAGNPHFWVNADGSYMEEGQAKPIGHLWQKVCVHDHVQMSAVFSFIFSRHTVILNGTSILIFQIGTKLLCHFLHLPMPPKQEVMSGVDGIPSGHLQPKHGKRLLLVGEDGSGTSTIFKQAKILYDPVHFSEDERQSIKSMIQSNLYGYLGIILEAREQFEGECLVVHRKRHSVDQSGPSGNTDETHAKSMYSINPRLRTFSDWLLKVIASGNLDSVVLASNCDYAQLIEELWNDEAIQATYDRRNELEMLPQAAAYFLDRVVEISRPGYEPSDMDILYAEGLTSSNGLTSMTFSLRKPTHSDTAEHSDPFPSYQLIRVHARSLGENCKWLEKFEDVDLILFCVSLTDYDQFFIDNDGVPNNKIMASKKLFESIICHPTFDEKPWLLLLTKFDLLEEKILRVPLTHCEWFDDYDPVISHNQYLNNHGNNTTSMAQRAFYYIAVKFKRLFYSITGRNLYVLPVTGLEPDTVEEAFRHSREILKWDLEKTNFSLTEWPNSSIEESTSS
ncbi:Guanine nucleotide binding protein (G-protein), alpha subunit [Dillenia turbinata]|uniref:Guanine nucleotide binding protein (G-protein), alpha subunit n=1 Tax=Dillenia turbinata TaxID=194707 RepID=A0AAN8UGR1_9MAGN